MVENGAPRPERYAEAVRLLAKLHATDLPATLPVAEGIDHVLPPYDKEALLFEAELLPEWYAPAIRGVRLPQEARDEFVALWREALDGAIPERPTWTLRDYHSPNLIWLPNREGLERVGVIDFQDAVMGHPAYDVASLLQDARVDASADFELRLLGLYVRERRARDANFDMSAFATAYALLAAQRATKILGIFARLDRRDGKPAYLAHLPRIEGYLARNLAHPALAAVRDWHLRHLPGTVADSPKPDPARRPGRVSMSDASETPITRAFVLAAGLGTRMRPVTDTLPKPLVKVAGKSLLDHALDRAAEAGLTDAVVNVHWLAEQIEAHVAARSGPPRITVSDEREALLETGGGIRKALPLMGDAPFVVLNSDSFWLEGPAPNLSRLVAAWDGARMDALLLVAPTTTSLGYEGAGDFAMDTGGRLERRGERKVAPFIYAGVAILKPALFADTPEGAFSLNLLFDRAIAAQRLYGMRLDGQWLHVGTPEAIRAAEERVQASVRIP